jgi:hypothetical protein
MTLPDPQSEPPPVTPDTPQQPAPLPAELRTADPGLTGDSILGSGAPSPAPGHGQPPGRRGDA